jgi:hypothetical protein
MTKAAKKPASASANSLSYFQDDGGTSRLLLVLLNKQSERDELDQDIRDIVARLADLHGIDTVYPRVFPAAMAAPRELAS